MTQIQRGDRFDFISATDQLGVYISLRIDVEKSAKIEIPTEIAG